MKYYTYETKEEASNAAYKLLKELMTEKSTLGLATGGTPTDLYKEMVKDYKLGNFSYKNITTFNLDEYVGLDYNHRESYHSFMDNHLFDHIDIKRENINIPDANNKDIESAITLYKNKLNEHTIDIQILGVGSNGHIGFNEPGTPFDSTVHIVNLNEETINANSRFFCNNPELVPKQAMTMGIKDIMRAKHIILLAFGKEKRQAIKNIMTNSEITEQIPCTILKEHKNVHIFVDKEANFE